jgi:hypothetical protein
MTTSDHADQVVRKHLAQTGHPYMHAAALELEAKDGMIWIRGLPEDAAMGFADFEVASLTELIKIYKDGPTC